MAEGDWPKVDGDVFFASEANKLNGRLGEIRQFALSITGAITKAVLQAEGWAICDGTTPASQGIADATITTTPDLREKFLRHSANETTGGTGTQQTLEHNHRIYSYDLYYRYIATGNATQESRSYRLTGTDGKDYIEKTGVSTSNAWVYYDICYFIKVK